MNSSNTFTAVKAALPSRTVTNQSVERTMGLLEAVASRPRAGITLRELVALTGLTKPTAHRLLLVLRKLGFIEYEASTRHFFPGLKVYRMGLASAARFDIAELADRSMSRLADETGDTVYLSLYASDQALCAGRKVGAFPIRTLTLNVGDFRPLGVGAGSLVLLAALPNSEIDTIMSRNRERLSAYPNFDPMVLHDLVTRTRRQGFALNDGLILREMAAVAMPIHNASGKVVAALSVAAITSRMMSPRREMVLRQLTQEIASIEATLGTESAGSARP